MKNRRKSRSERQNSRNMKDYLDSFTSGLILNTLKAHESTEKMCSFQLKEKIKSKFVDNNHYAPDKYHIHESLQNTSIFFSEQCQQKNKNKYRVEISITTLYFFLVTGKHDKKSLAFAMLDVLVNQNFMGRKISFLSNFSLILNSNKRKLISDIYKTWKKP